MDFAGSTALIEKFEKRFELMNQPGDIITCKSNVTALYKRDGKKYVELSLQAEKGSYKRVGSGKAILSYSDSPLKTI